MNKKTAFWKFDIHIFLQKINTYWHNTVDYLNVHYPYFVAGLLSLFSAMFFMAISLPSIFKPIPFFSQRFVGISILFLCFLVSFLFGYFCVKNRLKLFILLVQSNLLTLFTFTYFLRVNAINIQFLGINFNTMTISVPLVFLIHMVNLNLFKDRKFGLYLVMAQVVVFSLQGYAFINLLSTDYTNLRIFSTDWLASIFNLNTAIWIVVSSFAISVVSFANYKLINYKDQFVFFILSFLLYTQVLFLIDNLTFLNYWHKTILFLIFWDFIYTPMQYIALNIKDEKYTPKLIVSTIYHVLLAILVLSTAFLQYSPGKI